MKIKYVTDVFLDEYKTNFDEKYLPLYRENKIDSINAIFSSENIIESDIDFKYQELETMISDSSVVKANIRRLWESLKHLTIVEASNEKMWVALENTDYLGYHLSQLQESGKILKDASIKSRTIFNRGTKRSLMINNLSMGSYVKNPDIKVRTNLTFNLNYLI
ncbi:DUF6339 family protein [Latilactobacillus sakei]|uniref:DUF6339 family protein n=1 Tax=Latilactobacillus sakei TaxID=1599 RepID=UPI00207401F4|nr:DUF6339 family protein [Latilactobacillus sakei]USG09027.1 hypothetical protein A4W84_00670 [Latilactobacillus sakei]